jgi:hypothetical protein
VTADRIDHDDTSAGAGRKPWLAPCVNRFDAADAGAGDTAFNSADGDTAKS